MEREVKSEDTEESGACATISGLMETRSGTGTRLTRQVHENRATFGFLLVREWGRRFSYSTLSRSDEDTLGGGDQGRTHMYATEQNHVINYQPLSPCHCQWSRHHLQLGSAHNLPFESTRSTAVGHLSVSEGLEPPTSKTETSVPSNLTATFISAKNPSEAIIKSRPSFLDRCARSESMDRCSCGILL